LVFVDGHDLVLIMGCRQAAGALNHDRGRLTPQPWSIDYQCGDSVGSFSVSICAASHTARLYRPCENARSGRIPIRRRGCVVAVIQSLIRLSRSHHGYVRSRTNKGIAFVIKYHVGIIDEGDPTQVGGGLLELVRTTLNSNNFSGERLCI